MEPKQQNKDFEPLVSIIIPCYNQANFLSEAIESVINQTYQSWECIIVNDGSCDDTCDIARHLIAKYPKRDIKLIEKNNGGLSSARNTGIKVAEGEYVLPLDADDKIAPEMLSKTTKILNDNLDIGFVYSHIRHFGSVNELYEQPDFDPYKNVCVDNYVNVCSLIRKSVWEQVGGYNEYMNEGYEDWDFWIGCIEKGWKGYRIPEALFWYRKKEHSMLNEATEKRRYLKSRIVLNHPVLYSSEVIEQARKIVKKWEKEKYQQKHEEKKEVSEAVIPKQKIRGNGLKLHLGCGSIKIPDFINVDINPDLPAVDVVDDVCTLSRFNNNSASLIYACHVLEHFSHNEIIPILKRWREILEPGGELRISVPDIDRIVKVYINNWQHFQTPPNSPWIGLIYGGQNDKYDFHKTGFNFTYLKYLLEQAGFTHISEYPHKPHWLGITDASLANEPFKEYLSLNIKAKKAKKTNTQRQYHQPPEFLNILHTVELYNPHIGGSEVVVQQLSERLVNRGHNVTVVTTRLHERTFDQLNGVQIEQFDVGGNIVVGLTGRDIDRYQQFLLKHPADIMMNYAAQQWATDLAFDTLDPTRSRRVNIIAPCGYSALSDNSLLEDPQLADYFNRIIPEYLPKYDAAVYHSGQYQDYQFAQKHAFNNSVIIPNGVCEEEFLQPPKLSFRQKFNITTKYMGLCVANFYKGKGQDKIIECIRQMNRPDFTMVFIGKESSELGNLYKSASGLNIKFCVGIDREETLAAYHEADIFLFGSEKECSPLVIVEAKASRTPFVSTDCGNVREWKGGIVCAPEKIAFYANRILDDEAIRRSLADDGWLEWKEKLTWESITDKYEQLYFQLYQKKFTSHTYDHSQTRSLQKIPIVQQEQCRNPKNTVAIIFSKDRAIQLHATIESFLLHCMDKENIEINVLYNTSSSSHTEQYEQLKSKFPEINFIKEVDFRYQTLSNIAKKEFILFLVDDNIFVKPFSLQKITRALQKEKDAFGFSLRLGKNTTYCYPLCSRQELPNFTEIGEGILKYHWINEQHDFGYPLEVSSSVYRSKDMLQLLRRLDFANPNTLEGEMAANKNFDPNLSYLLIFEESVTFCNPVNVVQNVAENKFGTLNNYTSTKLADYFSQGKLIDIEKYIGFTPNAAHQETELYFKDANIKKTSKPKFSIIMANYNNGKYIAEAIESVLNQTFKDWELIIVEDCSTDNSLEIINRYLKDERIRLIQHEKNKGYTAALRIGIANVRSEYFGILDSDDCLMQNAVATMYESHTKHPRSGMIYSQFVACHENLWPRRIGYCGKIPTGKTNLTTNLVSHFKTFKLNDYLKSLGYDEDILYAEDKDITYKMEEVTQLFFVDQCLYLFRELPDSHGHDETKARIGIQSWEKAKHSALERRKVLRNKLLGPNAHNPVEKLIITEIKSKYPQNKPEFSIITANYNHAKYIGESIKSVLNQSFENWELIIIDDGSTDNSLEVIEPYLRDTRIRLVKHQQNKGYTVALKTAISKVRSEYFGILDSDDCLTFDAIEIMYKEHVANPDCGFIYSQLQYCDEELLPLRVGINKAVPPCRTSLDCDTISQFKTFKMSDYLKTEGYNENILYAEDKDIIYKMEEVTNLRFVDNVLYLVRELPDSICHLKNTAQIGRLATAKAKIYAIKRRCAIRTQSKGENFIELSGKTIKETVTKYKYDLGYYLIILKNLVPILRKAIQNGTNLGCPNVPENIMTCHIDDAALWFAINLDFIKVLKIIKDCDIMFDSPLVSVHILTGQTNRFIKRTIDSVLTQNYHNIELLIIDDSINGGVKEIINCFQDPRLRYIRRPFNNSAERMNHAIMETKKEYIIRIEPGDYIEQNYIEKMVLFAEKHPDIDYFYPASSTLIDEFDKPIKQQNHQRFSSNSAWPDIISKLEDANIPRRGCLIRKSLFAKAGFYIKSDTAEDLNFLRRNALKINFSRVDDSAEYFNRITPKHSSKDDTTTHHSEQHHVQKGTKKSYKPKFSIIMANYNNEKYIGEAIESVLNQTFKDWELIIVEDCSKDNSLEIINRYLNDKRIRLIQHDENKGYTAALKTGIANIKSEYFGILDSDDCLVDNAIEIMYDTHVKNPDCGLIYSQYVKCNSELNPREIGHCKKIPTGKTNLETNVVSHFKTFKLRDYLRTSGYDEDILYAEDRDIAYKMEEVTNLLFVDKCLYHYRELANSQGHNPRKKAIGMHTRQQATINAIKRRVKSCPDKLPASVLQQINTSTLQSSKLQEIPNKLVTISKQSAITEKLTESLVSVIMPAYNAADYIEEAIESVLCQTCRNFELIIIDDGSTDNTRDIIAGFKDNKIKYFHQENKGLAGAHNTGIKKSQGNFLIKLDSDDIMMPDFIIEHLKIFERYPQADLVYCDDCLIDENSKPIRVIKRPEYTDRKTLIRDLFHCGFPVVPFRTCIRRNVFDKIGLFDENLRMAEDYDMIRRFVRHGLKIQHLPSALYLRRMTSNSLSRNYSIQNAQYHFEVIRRFTDTFTYDELFPDVAWDKIEPRIRQMHAKCLIAGTYLAIGQEYVKSNNLTEYSKTAFDRACSELKDCVKMDPENQALQRLYQKSQLIRARYSGAPLQGVSKEMQIS